MRINKLCNLFLMLLFSSIAYANNAPLPAQLLLNIYQEPSPMKADDKYFLVYEIYLTNFMKDVARINSFQIDNDNKKSLITLDDIKTSIQPRDVKADKNIFEFNPGETKTIFIWIPFEKITAIPKKLTHHITIDSTFQNKKYSFNMDSYSISVNQNSSVIVDSPLRGKNWLSEPHLHFQIINNNSFLGSNGIPYGFKHFWAYSSELLNDESGSLKIKISNKNFKQYDNQLVLENALINFD